MPREAHYFFCQADVPRALPAEKLASHARSVGLDGVVAASCREAYEMAKGMAGGEDFIFIGGSTYVVADVLKYTGLPGPGEFSV